MLEWLATHPDTKSAIGLFTLCAVTIGLVVLAYSFAMFGEPQPRLGTSERI
jgi:hypothetical protein